MQNIIITHKNVGETPLDVIKKLKNTNHKLKTVKMAYAGRLDPMAEGLLLILVGDECKKRKEYENLPKTYEFEVLFGVTTDTYDVLGKITEVRKSSAQNIKSGLKDIIPKLIGKLEQPYPPFSAARVNGKPLYHWARTNKLHSVLIPIKQIEIYSIDLNNLQTVSKAELSKRIFDKLNLINGDFRQEEIKSMWENHFESDARLSYTIAKFTAFCSSGTYVRSLSNAMGNKLNTGAIALSIKRTQIGSYTLNDKQ